MKIDIVDHDVVQRPTTARRRAVDPDVKQMAEQLFAHPTSKAIAYMETGEVRIYGEGKEAYEAPLAILAFIGRLRKYVDGSRHPFVVHTRINTQPGHSNRLNRNSDGTVTVQFWKGKDK